MKLYIFEKGFNYSEDGEGNRLVYHLSACNLFCPWCSNPEGMEKGGKAYDTDEVLKEILSARPMFFDGGGVTFTGGECTLQADALLPLLGALSQNGVSVAVESNAATADFLRVAEACDIVIADYKSADAETLKRVTGADLSRVEENIKAILAKKYLHLRIPLVHGFNDSTKDYEGFAAFFERLPRDRFDVEILPYHEYGKEKWERCGKSYTVKNGHVSKETVRALADRLSASGIRMIKT